MKRTYTRENFIVCLLLLLPFLALSQSGSISGKITDEKNSPLTGASVFIKGSTRGTAADTSGFFRLSQVTEGKHTLVVTNIGYQTLERTVIVKGNVKYDFSLVPNSQSLGEVVVIGYGSQQRKDVTGAISSVSSKDFQRGNITSPEQLIAGKVAGVQITSNSGQPGAGSTIRIRGGASLNASNDPLIVIDGVPLAPARNSDGTSAIPGSSDPLALINPNDIESFTILKDANATAIYGSRASNGVILITTRKGRGGKPVINFISQNSVANVTDYVNVLSADELRAYVNASGSPAQIAMLGSANTNWQKEVYQSAYTADNNLSVSGKFKKLPYRVSFGYLDQNGVLLTDKMKRTSGAISLTPLLFDDHLKIDLNVKGSLSKFHYANQDALNAAIQFDPTQEVHTGNQFGDYYEWVTGTTLNPNAPRNPVGLIKLQDNNSKVNRSFGNVQFDYKFHFLPDLHANLNLGYDISRGKGGTFVPAYAAQSFSTGGSSTQYLTDIRNTVGEFYLNYSTDISKLNSSISATAGYGYYDNYRKTNNYANLSADGTVISGSEPTFPFDKPHNRLLSYYGRLIYTYNNKYIVSGTVRTDGSSRFNPDGRWGTFPSAAFTWKIKEEPFLKNGNGISDLKLRLSYGITGQQEGIANYSYLPNYGVSLNNSLYQLGETFYYMYTPVAYDSDIKWETTETYNAGIDYGFMNGRISGTVDVYYKKTKDLLSTIPIPVGTNFSNFLLTNVGNMENRGVEFSINAEAVRTKDLSWSVGFNYTYNKNKVTNLTAFPDETYLIEQGGITGATGNYIQAHTIGLSPYSFYVYKQVYDADGKPVEGLYADLNDDGIINDNDRYFYKSRAPVSVLGFSTQLNYKKWTLNAVLRSNIGNYVYDNVSSNLGVQSNVLSSSGLINNSPADLLNSGFSNNKYQSDYYIRNGSFLKMDNIGLGYDFGKVLKGIASLRLTANCQNVFTITDYKGLDPEINSGIDYKIYPRPRIYALGLNLGF